MPDSGEPGRNDRNAAPDDGGDAACWAHLVCTACGDVLQGDPRAHDDEVDQRP
jgi:hypothetical protein